MIYFMIYFIYFVLISFYVAMGVIAQEGNREVNCTVLRSIFAESTGDFISCAIAHSRPILFCEECVEYYLDLRQSYENMSQVVENGSLCIDSFINHDRLEIVQTIYENSLDLWNSAKCDKCFTVIEGKLTLNLSEEARTFTELYNSLMICINRTDLNETSLCSVCLNDYDTLNNYYYSVANINENISTCMDIVDTINSTWKFWSTNCCKYRRHDETIFLLCALLIGFLTLMFYTILMFREDFRPPAILQQRRFASSLSQTNNS